MRGHPYYILRYVVHYVLLYALRYVLHYDSGSAVRGIDRQRMGDISCPQ